MVNKSALNRQTIRCSPSFLTTPCRPRAHGSPSSSPVVCSGPRSLPHHHFTAELTTSIQQTPPHIWNTQAPTEPSRCSSVQEGEQRIGWRPRRPCPKDEVQGLGRLWMEGRAASSSSDDALEPRFILRGAGTAMPPILPGDRGQGLLRGHRARSGHEAW